jgi:autoinducer 2-degrading protein
VYAIVVRQKIQPEHLEAYLELMLSHARGSLAEEPGCLRFDVVQNEADPSEVFLYEVYRDQAALDEHGKTPRFARVVSTIKHWFAEPEQVTRCRPAFVTEAARSGH